MSLDARTHELATYWSTAPVFDAKTRADVSALLNSGNNKELTERFYRDLEFGTGGMRGIIGAGSARMNIYNVRKASAALALYVKECHPEMTQPKIAVSHDSRHFSREFALAACEVFAAYGIKAIITAEMRPVPMLSFMVRHFGCQAGVCVTASHNPPAYNGYKVYWDTGGQVTPPHDKAIIARYGAMTKYEDIKILPFAQAQDKGLIEIVGAEFDEIYFAKVKSLSLSKAGREGFKIVYSPLHGAGLYPVTEMLKRFGFNDVHVVPEQREPNGDFPTVKYPNPEEPEAMAMAVALGKKIGANLVIATDPDCDRLGIVEREGSEYLTLNGNQIGSLLIDFVLRMRHEAKSLPASPLVIKTVVTTDLQRDIAQHYGAVCEETLTGFKWICGLIEEYENGSRKPYKHYVCGGEESYGFLHDSFVRDKDGVISACTAAEMVAYYHSRGMTLTDALDEIFLRHGVYHESLHTLTMPGKDGADRIKGIMHALRLDPPRVIAGNPVDKLRDFELCQESRVTATKLEKTNDLTLPKSDVLQFIMADGSKVSVRPSGTEPKIKFYVSVKEAVAPHATKHDLAVIKTRCQNRVADLENAFVALAEQS